MKRRPAPTPLACKCEPGVGILIPQTPSTQPHPPRSQTRAGGGFTRNHHHPTFLARKREPRVGLLATTTTPPSSLANTSRGWVFHPPPSGQQHSTQAHSTPCSTPSHLDDSRHVEAATADCSSSSSRDSYLHINLIFNP